MRDPLVLFADAGAVGASIAPGRLVLVVILLAAVGSSMSRRPGQDLERLGARDADRQFERPPNEGYLL